MSNILEILQKAIREKKEIKIYLTSKTSLKGCIPVHVVFGNPESKTELKETAHHEDFEEFEIQVDNDVKPYIAWSANEPGSEVINVHFDYEEIAGDRPIYAFLDTNTEDAWEMEQVREELVDYLKNVLNEGRLAEEVEEDDDVFYALVYIMR